MAERESSTDTPQEASPEQVGPRDGIHLTTEQRDRALEALATINFGAAAAHQLMGDAVDAANMHEAGAYCTAVEAIAKVTCRSCDVLAALLGDPGFGSFRAEFEVDRA